MDDILRCPICGVELGLPDDRIYVDKDDEPVACCVCYDYGDDDEDAGVHAVSPELFWMIWRP